MSGGSNPFLAKRRVSISTAPKKTSRHIVMSISTPPMLKLVRNISRANSIRIAPMAAATKFSTPPMTAIATTMLICKIMILFGVTIVT